MIDYCSDHPKCGVDIISQIEISLLGQIFIEFLCRTSEYKSAGDQHWTPREGRGGHNLYQTLETFPKCIYPDNIKIPTQLLLRQSLTNFSLLCYTSTIYLHAFSSVNVNDWQYYNTNSTFNMKSCCLCCGLCLVLLPTPIFLKLPPYTSSVNMPGPLHWIMSHFCEFPPLSPSVATCSDHSQPL